MFYLIIPFTTIINNSQKITKGGLFNTIYLTYVKKSGTIIINRNKKVEENVFSRWKDKCVH